MLEENINIIINVLFHMAILFTFLSILFWVYIRKVETDEVTSKLEDVTGDATQELLKRLPKLPGVDWKKVIDWCNSQIGKASTTSKSTKDNNKEVERNIYIINGVLWGAAILSVIIVKSLGLYLPLKWIIGQNAFIFIFIGALEFMFFTKVVSKYIPITPDQIIIDILNLFEY